ncbi:MAG: GNAT family N-acetyltransferase [Planctomycetes bacterium]|nr:GNAT family N-acetyltransferase [Planctomycetota bacterium]
MASIVTIKPAGKADLDHIKYLFTEYAKSLGIDLSFQNFDKELSALPGEYISPDGRLLICKQDKTAIGCVALRKISKEVCEMKRLYVKPNFRKLGIGKSLVNKVINEARKIGYKQIWLDTLPNMKEAISLYNSLGFFTIKPYRNNPVKGAKFMGLNLNRFEPKDKNYVRNYGHRE